MMASIAYATALRERAVRAYETTTETYGDVAALFSAVCNRRAGAT